MERISILQTPRGLHTLFVVGTAFCPYGYCDGVQIVQDSSGGAAVQVADAVGVRERDADPDDDGDRNIDG